MRSKFRPLLFLVLALVLLAGCGTASAPQATEVPSPTLVLETTTPTATPTPTPTPTATPTPTPEPTPTPTPTPTPVPTMDPESDAANYLIMDFDGTIQVTASKLGLRLYSEPDTKSEVTKLRNSVTDSQVSDYLILDTVTGANEEEYYYVQAIFSLDRGYIPAAKAKESRLTMDNESGYAMLVRPGVNFHRSWWVDSRITGQRSYCAVRVLGATKGYAYVVSEDGLYGFVDENQLQYITRDEMEQYLITRQQQSEAEAVQADFSMDDVTDQMEAALGESADSMEQYLYETLQDAGLVFNPVYYQYFKKVYTEERYPQGLYTEEVYNTLLFKLRNSSGDLVTCNGEETEWAYVPTYEELERGDIIFFAEYSASDTAVVPNVEVVLRGPDSGYVTSCGVYLGDDKMLTVQNGTLTIVENLSASSLMTYFDGARRIHPTVTDLKAHLIERQISMIYDRLGTPYHNFNRTGDITYDCSGIISWSLDSMGVCSDRKGTEFTARTAQSFSLLKKAYFEGRQINYTRVNSTNREEFDMSALQRGDYVLLVNSGGSRIGHIMTYLGNGRVIHSTTIDKTYRGTLVAGIRPALQKLYYNTVRISDITE